MSRFWGLRIDVKRKWHQDDKQGLSYGLKSDGSVPQERDLIQSKDDLVRIVEELNFCKVKNEFQKNAIWRYEKGADIKEDTDFRRQDIQHIQIE